VSFPRFFRVRPLFFGLVLVTSSFTPFPRTREQVLLFRESVIGLSSPFPDPPMDLPSIIGVARPSIPLTTRSHELPPVSFSWDPVLQDRFIRRGRGCLSAFRKRAIFMAPKRSIIRRETFAFPSLFPTLTDPAWIASDPPDKIAHQEEAMLWLSRLSRSFSYGRLTSLSGG